MLQVGLTGNIASGKSHASSVFAELGARIIDADLIAHELFLPGSATYRKVVQAFGDGIVAPDGAIDRKILGHIVFHDTGQRMRLNAVVHPDVIEEVANRVRAIKSQGFTGVLIIDAALLVESGFHREQDRLVLVTCDPALQLARVMNRYGLGEGEAKLRMAAQMPVADKLKLADYVIDTSGTYAGTRVQIERIYRDLIAKLNPTPKE